MGEHARLADALLDPANQKKAIAVLTAFRTEHPTTTVTGIEPQTLSEDGSLEWFRLVNDLWREDGMQNSAVIGILLSLLNTAIDRLAYRAGVNADEWVQAVALVFGGA